MKKKTLFGLCDSGIISTYTYPHGAFCYLLLSSQVYFAILVTHSNVNTLCLSLSLTHTHETVSQNNDSHLSLSLSLSLYDTHKQTIKQEETQKKKKKKKQPWCLQFCSNGNNLDGINGSLGLKRIKPKMPFNRMRRLAPIISYKATSILQKSLKLSIS